MQKIKESLLSSRQLPKVSGQLPRSEKHIRWKHLIIVIVGLFVVTTTLKAATESFEQSIDQEVDRIIDRDSVIDENTASPDAGKNEPENPQTSDAKSDIKIPEGMLFLDVDNTHPNFLALEFLKGNGIIDGYEDGNFRPEQKINRAEALKIILVSAEKLSPELTFEENFGKNTEAILYTDVPQESWYFPYIEKATASGIVRGYDDGNFKPENTMNLAEGLKIIHKTFQATVPEVPAEKLFNDVSSNDWHAPYIQFFKEYFLIEPDEKGKIHPEKELGRAELAELIYRFVQREEFMKAALAKKAIAFISGKATYYGAGDGFNGRRTASGEIFDDTLMTAAHRDLPFNTWIRVYSVEDPSKFVEVRINDRGPYDYRFIIDLSAAAFEKLAPISRGFIDIKYEIIETPTPTPKE